MRSKHYGQRRLRDEDGEPIHGKCRIGDNSSLRKLMRAARQGKIPSERTRLINNAMWSARR